MQGINLFNKGLILSNVGKVDKAMEAFSKSQELIEAGDHEKQYLIYFNMGLCARKMGNKTA